jgi:hypothetical protein
MMYAIRLLSLCALSLGAVLLAADARGNAALATHAMPCADMNGDGKVDFSDVDVVLSWYLQPVFPPALDVFPSGTVTVADILYVFQQLGTTTSCQDTPVNGHGTFPGLGDDLMPSLGTFRILVAAPFRSMMAGYPGYDGVSRLTSPTMSDSATKVGRSAVVLDGSAADTAGTAVGTAGTIVSDSSFSLVPPGFQGPAGVRELHTELRTMDLAFGTVHVRAGTAAPSRPISVGEVESHSTSGLPADDWPAESFFDVFVEVDLPAFASFPTPGATLYNPTALLVHNTKLQRFPPKVIYVHDNTSAVPVVFKTANPGFWQAGDLFGYLVLAGHGANFDANSSADVQAFDDGMAAIEQAQGEMPLPSVGGIAELPQAEAAPLAADDASGPNALVAAGIAAGALAVALAIAGAAWWGRRALLARR